MKFKDNESGQVLVITAVCLVAFMGFLALAVDVGILFHTKRELQVAADAAATAAAVEYIHNGYDTSKAIAVGNAAATDNNIADGNTMSANVTVNANAASPAAHKVCSGTTCYFEAIVSKPNPTIFYKTFFSGWTGNSATALTVSARAVAGTPGTASGCAYLTASTGAALNTQGSWSFDASGCGVYINSNSNSVENDTGKAKNSGVSASSISIVGPAPNDITIASGSNPTITQVIPQTIPFTNLTPPSTPTTCSSATTLTGTVSAGCYSATNISIGTATLGAGTYFFTGGGTVTINGALSGTGVTLDIASNTGNLEVKPGNTTINLTPPTTGAFNGVSIYQPLANKNAIGLQAGHATGSIGGFIVAPGAELSMQDNGGSMTVGGLVVNDISLSPAQLSITGYTPTTSPLKYVALVE